jgi:hypothetical protein
LTVEGHELDESDGREVRSSLARIERDVDRLDRKLDSFLTQHAGKHDTEQQAFHTHLLTAEQINARGISTEKLALELDARLVIIENWRQGMLGALSLMRLALGASILSAILAIVTLVRYFFP